MMQERAVPATQLGRFMGFGSLAVRMAMGEAIDRASHAMSGDTGPRYISEQNAERLAESLCRMRGAALKLGQMLSLQDESSLPPSLAKALARVKQAADYMPRRQLEAQLVTQLGADWQSKVAEFDFVPIAAASIGQVHRARLHDGTEVAMKVQYPGVAESIDSDLSNLKTLVQMTNLLPPGLFVDKIIEVASVELKAECDYTKEATAQIEYRELILADKILRKHTYVPQVYSELSSSRVLTTELVPGEPVDLAVKFPQAVRNAIARTVLIATIRELFEWRFIQSDPNFANFLYDDPSRTINMIDFGAARRYSKDFVDGYMKLVWAAANKDREMIKDVSKDLGFITGDETQEFIDAHIEAGLVVGEPFLKHEPFDFGNSRLTARIGQYGGTFMKYRLTPPPSEAYSLHRKLAGAFLLSIKLKAVIPCRDILETTFNEYKFGPVPEK
ncbi:ubiquinone biosynthesis protein [Ochromonadaceae sp. CCMP2298]|nr:ubiquinone biosynthesis protein [Ochromonadaceae sp. CCMP2298]